MKIHKRKYAKWQSIWRIELHPLHSIMLDLGVYGIFICWNPIKLKTRNIITK